jgi:DNA-directed RNA polymerase specialized sigma subunit
LYKKEVDTIALFKKQMSSREVTDIVGLLQSKMSRIRKKYFENIVSPRRGRPQALTT